MIHSTKAFAVLALALMAGGGSALAAPSASGGMSFFACHKAFQEAKKAGTLNGQNYLAFKSAHCSGSPQNTQTQPASSASSSSATTPSTPATVSSSSGMSSGNAGIMFPSRISPEFASLPAGKARMQTCLKQYNMNKDSGANGSLKWIEKNGGYYSQCNARLKK